MSDFSLYRRFTEQGTLSEPNGLPDPRFALPSTVNWMHALAMLVMDQVVDFKSASSFYATVGKRTFSPQEESNFIGQRLVPTEGDSKEIGVKSSWFEERLNTSFAVFSARHDNLAE